MTKDRRYLLAKNQILGGHIRLFREIFDVIPKTVVLKDMKIHNQRFNDLLNNVSGFLLSELYQIADLIEVDEKIIVDMAHQQHVADQKTKPKNGSGIKA